MFFMKNQCDMIRDVNWYKKIIRSPKLRYAILNALSFIPDKIMLATQYYIKFGRKCNFKNPQRWTEKLQLYKMNYRNPILPVCVDKYEVRSYVECKGLGEYLVKLYGVYGNSSEIKVSELPKSFVIKTTNGGGGLNVDLVRDKDEVDMKALLNKYDEWVSSYKPNTVTFGREWAYSGINEARILIEELLINRDFPDADIEDFKILCFSGEPKYIIVDKDRYKNHRRNIYDVHWNRVFVTTDHEPFDTPLPKPKNYDRMMEIARLLSKEFPFVRVDLYNVAGRIFFGEMTFYPWTGYVQFVPDEFDFILGDLMDCSTFLSK